MGRRTFFSVLILIFSFLASLTARENRYFSSGTGQDTPLFVLVAPDHADTAAVRLLESFMEQKQDAPPPGRLLAAFTVQDFSDLPANLKKIPPEGAGSLIEKLSIEESVVMIVLLPGPSDRVRIHPGVRFDTPPRWLLESVVQTIQDHAVPFEIADSRLQVYRMGWNEELPVVRPYHDAGIPVLCLETSYEISAVLESLAETFSRGIPEDQDRHYLLQQFRDRIFFIGERSMVIFIITAFALILLFLFVFSFLSGTTAERRLRYTLSLWWLPFLFLVVNITALYAGQAVSSFLLRFRFGTDGSWALLPVLALAGKFFFAWFITTAILSLNQIFRFPDDNSVYGYLSTFCAMINVFVFSAFDFSLTPLFILLYGIAFIFYHLRHPLFTLAGIVILMLPLYPYARILASGTPEAVQAVFNGMNGWNIRLAFLALPFQFMISRFLNTMGLFGRKNDFYLPIQLFPATICAFILAGTLLFFPAWSSERPLPVQVWHIISKTGSRMEISSLAGTGTVGTIRTAESAPPEIPGSFLEVETRNKRFLDKQLLEIAITPMLPVNRIEVLVSSNRGISVYSATIPFTYQNAGQDTLFVSPDDPEGAFSFNFSSDSQSQITATVRLYTRENPFGVQLSDENAKMDYLLEVVQTVVFPRPQGENSAAALDG